MIYKILLVNERGYSLAMLAAEYGREVEEYMKHHSDLRNKNGYTLWMIAIRHKR